LLKKRWENYIFCNGIRKKNGKIFNQFKCYFSSSII
jgi:hypothetical protein